MLTWYGVELKKGDKLSISFVDHSVDEFTLKGVSVVKHDKIVTTINGFPQAAKETVLLVEGEDGNEYHASVSTIWSIEKVD